MRQARLLTRTVLVVKQRPVQLLSQKKINPVVDVKVVKSLEYPRPIESEPEVEIVTAVSMSSAYFQPSTVPGETNPTDDIDNVGVNVSRVDDQSTKFNSNIEQTIPEHPLKRTVSGNGNKSRLLSPKRPKPVY